MRYYMTKTTETTPQRTRVVSVVYNKMDYRRRANYIENVKILYGI